MIDSHLHLWSLEHPPGWLSEDLPGIHRTFTAQEAAQMHARAGYTGAVLVQVDDTLADTEHMLAVASAHPWVRGVVGWVDLTDPGSVEEHLEGWGIRPAGTGPIAGIRHLVHDDPRPDFLDLPTVRESLAILTRLGLPLDIPDAFPRHLRQATALAEETGIVVVIDHLGKPPTDRDAFALWREQIIEAARRENTVGKVSGLHHGGRTLERDLAAEVLEIAMEHFGPPRLMVGSDWPMPLLADGIEPQIRLRDAFLAQLSPDERTDVEFTTAERIYHLDPSR